MPYGGPPRDIGPTQGIAGGPGPTPAGFDDGTPKPVPETMLPEPVAQEDARETAEPRSSASSQRPGTKGRRPKAGDGKRKRVGEGERKRGGRG